MSGRTAGQAAALCGAGLAVALVGVTLGTTVLSGRSWAEFADSYGLSNVIIGASLAATGVVLSWNRPRLVLGWLFLTAGLGYLLSASALGPLASAVKQGWPELVTRALGTLFMGAWPPAVGLLLPLAVLLFPEGRLSTTLDRVLGSAIILNGLIFTAGYALTPVELPTLARLPESALWFRDISNLVSLVLWVAVLAVLAIRFRSGSAHVREQILWVGLALVVALAASIPLTVFGIGEVAVLCAYALIPVGVLIAVIRTRLFDIRLVFARGLAWLLLTLVIIAIDAVAVGLLTAWLGAGPSSVVGALVAAIAFEPLRRALQRGADRLVYGRRDPDALLRSLSERMAGRTGVDSLLAGLASELALPAVELRVEGIGAAARTGRDTTDEDERVPLLRSGDQRIGELIVGLRSGQSRLTRADRRALTVVIPVFSALAESLRLSSELAASRTRVLEAAESERVRLQRDLHDEVASALTGIQFKVAAAAAHVDDALTTREILATVQDDLRSALGSVRVVIDELRPPELARFGLEGALRERWRNLAVGPRPIRVRIVCDLPSRLPAAVEVAAFRIVNEASTNAARHSDASELDIRISATSEAVELDLRDNGSAHEAWTDGTGLLSMRERVALLNGHLEAAASASGGRVWARLPLIEGPADA